MWLISGDGSQGSCPDLFNLDLIKFGWMYFVLVFSLLRVNEAVARRQFRYTWTGIIAFVERSP